MRTADRFICNYRVITFIAQILTELHELLSFRKIRVIRNN
jgi:hypothetical protein